MIMINQLININQLIYESGGRQVQKSNGVVEQMKPKRNVKSGDIIFVQFVFVGLYSIWHGCGKDISGRQT